VGEGRFEQRVAGFPVTSIAIHKCTAQSETENRKIRIDTAESTAVNSPRFGVDQI
jgi:hypothetical protein